MLASKDKPNVESAPTALTPALQVSGLDYRYPNGLQALSGVSLTIAPGEKVALIGPNGAGKSTLLLHLNGIIRAQRGSVSVYGEPVTQENLNLVVDGGWIDLATLCAQATDPAIAAPICSDAGAAASPAASPAG